MSYHYLVDFPLPEKFNFAGIALYKDSDKYSEYIQGQLASELIKDKRYCFRIKLALSSYSRYNINQLGIHFSEKSLAKNVYSTDPTISFSDLPDNSRSFVSLCKSFIAQGGEKYITLGRFSQPDQIKIIRRDNIPMSSFGLENSAYYLIDNVELFELNDSDDCKCSKSIIQIAAADTSTVLPELEKLKAGGSIILKNVNFEFDSFKLLPKSDAVLNEILNYMGKNPDINLDIAGHTDDVGGDDYNMTLSLNRAKSVYEWLIKNGIPKERLTYHGYGKTRPLYQTDDEKLKALNRRVEIKITIVL
jgi:outer membrane protein OmpA-like peptidoglycan-associated protein